MIEFKKKKMNSNNKKNSSPIIGLIIDIFYGLIKLHFPGLVLGLLIIIILGEIITKNGLFLVLGILIFGFLFYLRKRSQG
jgi:hypothetical protein